MEQDNKERFMTGSSKTINVGDIERVVSAVAGGVLVTWGLRRRSLGGLALVAAGAELVYRGVSGHCQVNEWLGRNTAQDGPVEVTSSVTINKPADALYRLWREPDTLSRIMGQFADVESFGENRMHWRTPEVMGKSLEWDADITEQRAGELLCWRSSGDAPLPNDGEVHFHEALPGNGTEVRLTMRFHPPGGALGRAAIKALGPTPRSLACKALDRFKSLAETGEIMTPGHNPPVRTNGAAAQTAS